MEGPMLKLGDASIAAAFTARSASVTSCVSVILQALPSYHPYLTLHALCSYAYHAYTYPNPNSH